MPRLFQRYFSTHRIPGQIYLWVAILIFGASSAVTRRLTELGAQHFIDGRNPVSLCNVLFVGNLCALMVLLLIYRQQWDRMTLGQLSQQHWRYLVIVAVLAGAIAPALVFQSLMSTPVNNVVLVGRLEPPLTLALSVWYLRERVNWWEVVGAIVASVGVCLTIALQPAKATMMSMGGFGVGLGELLVALSAIALSVATILGKRWLAKVPLGIYSVVRTGLGTIIFFVIALLLYGSHHFMDVLSPFLWQWMLVYGVVIVVVGQSCWIAGLRASTVSTASIVGSFTPIAGILAAYFVLGEAPTVAQYIGGSAILLGICLSQFGIHHRTMASAATAGTMSVKTEQAIETDMGFKGI